MGRLFLWAGLAYLPTMGHTPSQIAPSRAAQIAGGSKKLSVWLTPNAQAGLDRLVERTGASREQVINHLLEAANAVHPSD